MCYSYRVRFLSDRTLIYGAHLHSASTANALSRVRVTGSLLIGSTVSDAIVRSCLGSAATMSSEGYFNSINASS